MPSEPVISNQGYEEVQILMIRKSNPTEFFFPLFYPLIPEDIDTSGYFREVFITQEANEAARWIIRYCQAAGAWVPLTQPAIETFSGQKLDLSWLFNENADLAYLVSYGGKIYLTHKLVAHCYKLYPAKL